MTVTINGTTGITAPGVETFGNGTALGGTTNPIVAMTGASTNYVQAYVVNNTNGTSSSADLVAYPSNGNDSHGWVDMGITSQSYADTTYTVTGPNESYLFGSAPSGSSTTGNLVYATDNTGTQNAHQFYVGGFTQAKSAYKFVIESTGAHGQLIQGTAQASTSGTSITFSSIPSWVKRITVMFNGVSTSGSSNKLVQIGSGSVTSTGYVSAGGNISGATGFGVASSTAGFIINSADASDNLYGSVVINLVTGNTYGAYGTLGDVTGTYVNAYTVSGGVTLGGALDRVVITTVNGTDTFDAGSINILYEG